MHSSATYPVVATDDQVQSWLGEQIDAATKFFTGISGNVNGVNQIPMGPLFGFAFLPILYGGLAHFKESWADPYRQVTIGTLGERYDKVKTGVDEAGKDVFDLTITLRQLDENGQPITMVLHGWHDGDLGIHLVDTGWRTGLESNTNKNGRLTIGETSI